MATNDGGPAFPNEGIVETSPHAGMNGMSLRDYFAAKVIGAMNPLDYERFDHMAIDAYRIADAMLSAREAKP